MRKILISSLILAFLVFPTVSQAQVTNEQLQAQMIAIQEQLISMLQAQLESLYAQLAVIDAKLASIDSSVKAPITPVLGSVAPVPAPQPSAVTTNIPVSARRGMRFLMNESVPSDSYTISYYIFRVSGVPSTTLTYYDQNGPVTLDVTDIGEGKTVRLENISMSHDITWPTGLMIESVAAGKVSESGQPINIDYTTTWVTN